MLLVGGIAVAAIVAAIAHDDGTSHASAADVGSTAKVSLCDSAQLALSIRASGFGAHVAALRLSGAEPCNVGELDVRAIVVDRNGKRSPTRVAPPRKLTGEIGPDQELISTFDYSTGCRQKAPFTATVIAAGEIGSLRATTPVTFRRDPFSVHPC